MARRACSCLTGDENADTRFTWRYACREVDHASPTLCGDLLALLVAALAARVTDARHARHSPEKDAPKSLTLTGCVTPDSGNAGHFTLADFTTGTPTYRLTGTDFADISASAWSSSAPRGPAEAENRRRPDALAERRGAGGRDGSGRGRAGEPRRRGRCPTGQHRRPGIERQNDQGGRRRLPAPAVATFSLLFLAASASAGRAQDTETPKLDVVLRAGIVFARPGDAGGVDFQGRGVTALSAGIDSTTAGCQPGRHVGHPLRFLIRSTTPLRHDEAVGLDRGGRLCLRSRHFAGALARAHVRAIGDCGCRTRRRGPTG